MMRLYYNNQKLINGSILTLFLIYTSFQYSFAQSESERADEINQNSKESLLVCDFVQFCSTPVESALNGTETSVITPVTPQSEARLKVNSSELLPNVLSNISLIMSPDLPANLVSENFQRSTNERLQVKNESIDTISNSLIQNISTNDTLIDSKVIPTYEANSESYSSNESISSTLANNNTRPSLGENLANIEEHGWKNFTFTDGYSFSYPPGWNLTTYENEVYIESNQLESDYYPKMTFSVRDLDPSRLNNSFLLADILPIDDVPSEIANILLNDTKVLSNIGLKYYIDLDYNVLEPTQERKYVIDGKQSSSFKVHDFGDNYEKEHITVINDDKIYSIEINSDYFSSSDEADQIKQTKEEVLKSIIWINDTKPIRAESRITEIDSNSTTFNEESKDGSVLPSDITDDNEIKKTIASSESDLNITSSTHFFDGENLKVVGEVLNEGSNNRELVKVVITLYDEDKNVIGTELTYTEPTEISSQQSAPFEVIIGKGDVSNTSAIKSYKLYLTSDVKASSNSDVQSSPISNTTTITPLDKLMNLFNNKNSTIVSDPLSNNLGNSRPIENTNLVPTKTTDDMMVDVSIVPGASLLGDTAYSPNPIYIDVGSAIRWTNDDTAFHTVTSGLIGAADAGKGFDSGLAGPAALTSKGKTFEHTFNEPGEYPYFCTLHPFMTGKIIVG